MTTVIQAGQTTIILCKIVSTEAFKIKLKNQISLNYAGNRKLKIEPVKFQILATKLKYLALSPLSI